MEINLIQELAEHLTKINNTLAKITKHKKKLTTSQIKSLLVEISFSAGYGSAVLNQIIALKDDKDDDNKVIGFTSQKVLEG